MYIPPRSLLSLPHILLLLLSSTTTTATTTQHCYYPSGALAEPGTVPCNTTATVSPCCDPRDSCSTSGMCLGASGWIYRSACTDQTWQSPDCPQLCQIDPNTNLKYTNFASIFPCPAAAGVGTADWCCGSQNGKSCCNASFELPNTGLAFKPGDDAVQAQLASLSSLVASATSAGASGTGTAASAAAATTSSSTTGANVNGTSNGGTSIGTAVGVGVGVPLGVLALGVLGFLIWRERRIRKFNGGEKIPELSELNGLSRGNGVVNHNAGAYETSRGREHKPQPWPKDTPATSVRAAPGGELHELGEGRR